MGLNFWTASTELTTPQIEVAVAVNAVLDIALENLGQVFEKYSPTFGEEFVNGFIAQELEDIARELRGRT